MKSMKKTARIAGLLFLLMVVSGLFAELFFRQELFTKDAAETAARIAQNTLLFRAGILSDIIMSLSYLLTALMLYRLLRTVDEDKARLMVLFAAAGSVILLMNVLNEYMPLVYATTQAGALSAPQLGELSALSFSAYNNGYMIGQVFFALWVLPLGQLICRSKFIPKVFGILFIIETVCGLLSVAAHFLLDSETVATMLLLPGTVAEFGLLFWLLIRGVNEKKLTPTLA
jgi:hypothetical protein